MNILALRGSQITDGEYIEQFGLDPSLEGKPELNDAMLEVIYQKNLENYRAQEKTEEEAVKLSKQHRVNAANNLNKIYKKKGIKHVSK